MTYWVAADVMAQMFALDAGNDPETLRGHTLKIGAELRDQAAVQPETAAPAIAVTLAAVSTPLGEARIRC